MNLHLVFSRLWQIGYGYADVSAAVDMVRAKRWVRDLARASAAADRRVAAADGPRCFDEFLLTQRHGLPADRTRDTGPGDKPDGEQEIEKFAVYLVSCQLDRLTR